MVREYPALVITDARDLSENSGNPAFAHPNLCPDLCDLETCDVRARPYSRQIW